MTASHILPLLHDPKRVFHIHCGDGSALRDLAAKAYVSGITPAGYDAMMAMANHGYRNVRVGTVASFVTHETQYDAVISFDPFRDIADWTQFILLCCKLVRRGGVVAFGFDPIDSTPNLLRLALRRTIRHAAARPTRRELADHMRGLGLVGIELRNGVMKARGA